MERIEHILKNAASLKVMNRKLGAGKNKLYVLRDKEGYVTTNMDKIIKVAEDLYRDMCSSRDNHDDNGRGSSPEGLGVAVVPVETGTYSRGGLATQGNIKRAQDYIAAKLCTFFVLSALKAAGTRFCHFVCDTRCA